MDPERSSWSTRDVDAEAVPVGAAAAVHLDRLGAMLRDRDVYVVGGLSAVAAVLRFPTLGGQSLWYDETVTASLVRLPFGELLRALPDSETAPPLYYVLAWIWTHVFGSSDVALRSFSALIGILVVPAAYLAARALVSRRAGILVALFATVSPLLVWYSQEARAYSLLLLLSTLSLYGFARVWEAPSRRRVLFWGAVSCLAVVTYYFAIFLVVAEAVALLVRHRFMRSIVLASGAVVVLIAALAPLAFAQGRTGNAAWIDGIPMATRAEEAIRQLVTAAPAPAWAGAGGAESRTHDLWILAAVVVILAVAAVLRYVHGRERVGALLALGLGAAVIVVPLVLSLASGLVSDTRGDVFLYRALLPAWTPLAIVVAAGFGARRAGKLGLAAVGALVAASLAVTIAISLDRGLQRDDWQAIAAATAGEGVVVVTPSYQHHALLHYRDDLELRPPGGVTATELEIVSRVGQTGPERLEPPPGFVLVDEQQLQRWIVRQYRSPAGVEVDPARFAGEPAERTDFAVLTGAAGS